MPFINVDDPEKGYLTVDREKSACLEWKRSDSERRSHFLFSWGNVIVEFATIQDTNIHADNTRDIVRTIVRFWANEAFYQKRSQTLGLIQEALVEFGSFYNKAFVRSVTVRIDPDLVI